jgi:hypothetical protein
MKYDVAAALQNMLSLLRLKALPVAAGAPQMRSRRQFARAIARPRGLSLFPSDNKPSRVGIRRRVAMRSQGE